MITDYSVLRTLTIRPNIRIFWDLYFTFILTLGQIPRTFTHLLASSYKFKPFYFWIIYMMLGSKAPNCDAYGLFRATHSHNPPQYSHIVEYTSHFYAHIGAGLKAFHLLMSKLMRVQTFWPWHYIYKLQLYNVCIYSGFFNKR